ncbi:MAG: hypothetical protein ABJE99_20150 [Roseobacter sp.]
MTVPQTSVQRLIRCDPNELAGLGSITIRGIVLELIGCQNLTCVINADGKRTFAQATSVSGYYW